MDTLVPRHTLATSLALALLALGLTAASCSFDPDLDQRFTRACSTDADCGAGQACGPEGFCFTPLEVRPDPDALSAEPDVMLCGGERCGAGTMCCDDTCIPILDDARNCGGCGLTCAAGQSCDGGVCVCDTGGGRTERCLFDETCCAGGCMRLDVDAQNCGACGVACSDGEQCIDGTCQCGDTGAACGADERCCADACVAPDHPSCDCGPGGPCPGGSSCCDAGGTPVCYDLGNDPEHCGACDVVCAPGEECRGGACVCGTGRSDCDGDPTNGCETLSASDVTHCGGCGIVCDEGLGCVSGRCVCPDGRALGTEQNCGACGSTCGHGETCCDGQCQALSSDPRACGACGTLCAENEGCCDGTCVALDGLEHCGVCGNFCDQGESCCGGQCVWLAGDLEHCGACGNACTAPPGMQTVCNGGFCQATCEAGRADCDGDPLNGCEVDLTADLEHCGACGAVCGAHGGSARCEAGLCELDCSPGRADCDGVAANGCEADLDEVENCGGCGNVCAAANATAHCDDDLGRCEYTCAPGFVDCNGQAADGCEAHLATSPQHCGACGNACPAGKDCVQGVCTDSGCTQPGQNRCGDSCFDLATALSHCGACGNDCSTLPGTSTSACVDGACSYACAAGFADCTAARGCETHVASDVDNCGACGNVCPAVNSAALCTDGACGIVCANGRADCDGDLSNGCEVVLNGNVEHCGACGRACSSNNGTPTCTMGSCSIACHVGFADCDGDPSNGCEVDLRTSPLNCGGCNLVCSSNNATPACASGSCAPQCSEGYANCDGNAQNGCEVQLGTRFNCGACGDRCTGNEICCAGGCVRGPSCP